MVDMYDCVASNDTLSNPANFTPFMQTSLLCAANCKAGHVYVVKIAEIFSECGCAKNGQMLFSQSSKPNELIFNTMFCDSVFLKGPNATIVILSSSVCDAMYCG